MRIRLDAIEYHDLPQLRVWRNEIMQLGYVRQWRYLNELNQEEWWTKVSQGSEHLMLKILDEEDFCIGVVGLCYIDFVRRTGEVSIYIGDENKRGKGYGKEALILLLNYGFKTVNLNRIWGEIYVHNTANMHLFESLGFKQEGVHRSVHFFGGKYIDSRTYAILQDEWLELSSAC